MDLPSPNVDHLNSVYGDGGTSATFSVPIFRHCDVVDRTDRKETRL
jgi:hypothetical protein